MSKLSINLVLFLLLSHSVTAWTSLVEPFFEKRLVNVSLERTQQQVQYDGSYFSTAYPNGDVPDNIGVCSDVIIQSYRAVGVDLQALVHEDMAANFSLYPSKKNWGLNRPDHNIDHRRVPNLQVFFQRHGDSLPVTTQAKDYQPGNLVIWRLPGNLPHIGVVTDQYSALTGNPLIVHNIGAGPSLNDMLFDYPISGHYRYRPRVE